MTITKHDFGDVLVLLRKIRETPPYPWELFTHRGRVAHNQRWERQRARAVRDEAARRRVVIPDGWSDQDVAGMHSVFCGRIYEVAGFEPSGVVVDVGAGYGDYAVLTSRLPGVREVVALEPTPHTVRRAREFAAANGAQIRFVEAAGGSQAGRLRLGDAGTQAVSVFSDSGGYEVAVVAVDELGLDRVDFLKVDVEGAETAVLQGARRTLATSRPRIAIEVHSKALAKEVDDLLRGAGYTLAYHDKGVRASYPMDRVQNRFYRPSTAAGGSPPN
jgi:FkbM family methyltransferase